MALWLFICPWAASYVCPDGGQSRRGVSDDSMRRNLRLFSFCQNSRAAVPEGLQAPGPQQASLLASWNCGSCAGRWANGVFSFVALELRPFGEGGCFVLGDFLRPNGFLMGYHPNSC